MLDQLRPGRTISRDRSSSGNFSRFSAGVTPSRAACRQHGLSPCGRPCYAASMFGWLRSLSSSALAPARAAEPHDTRPPWVDELAQGLQKQSRAAAKQAARLEALIWDCSADLRLAREERGRSASAVATREEPYDDLFDALDALDQARLMAGEPHLVEGLSRVQLRIQQFCERAGFARIGAVGQPVDAASMRIVGTERAGEVPAGSISRVVCAAIRRRGQLVREGQVIVQIEEKNDESQLGY